MLGWRARIGVIVPATNTATEHEFWRVLPDGVSLSAARAISSRAADQVERLSAYREQAIKGALEVAEVRPDIIVWACTSGSFVRGAGYDRELSEAMQAQVGIPVLTTSTAVIEALAALRITRLAVGTPYPQQVTDIEQRFFEDSVPGLRIVSSAIIDVADPYSRGLITLEQAHDLALRANSAEAEAVFLSCTDLRTFEIIEMLERDLGKPVISSNLATLWATLRRLKLRPRVEVGSLWRHDAPPEKRRASSVQTPAINRRARRSP